MLLTKRQLVLLIILTISWGINWPIMKMALSQIPPFHYRAITMGGGAIILISWLLLKKQSLKVSKSDLTKIFWIAIPNMVMWHLFAILGVRELASGRASILGFTMSIWTVILSALIFRQRLTARIWISVISVAITVGLLTFNELSHLAGSPIGIIWMQIAAFSWALGTILIGKVKLGCRIEVAAAWMLCIGALIIAILSFFFEPAMTWNYDRKVWFTIFYGLVINFGIGQVIWFTLASSLPPSASAFSVMSIPVISIFSAAILTGEVPQITDFIATGFIIIAIASAVLIKKPAILKTADKINNTTRK